MIVCASPDEHRLPRGGGYRSIAARVMDFFEANPDEELRPADIALKCECACSTASRVLAQLAGEGILESVHIYRRRAP